MDRLRGIALLVVGLALAAAAAATGPYLARDVRPATPLQDALRRNTEDPAAERRIVPFVVDDRGPTWFETAVEWAFLALFVLLALYGLARLVMLLAALARLRLGGDPGRVATEAYDPGEESHDDAETALRKRVADELTALSADLDAPGDPREVVIACYARMEQAFAAAGAARRPDESPMELLARVLDELYVPADDVRRLTALFTEARFSAHPVTEEMREAARRALRSIANALTATA